jgi:hypothetical protein
MCNRPEPFIINYACLDVINSFSGRRHFQYHEIASLPSETRAARQCIRNLLLDTRDVLDLPVKIL